MSLKHTWQQQRQQRQQEVTQRQQTVYKALATTRQERQSKAAELRDELSLFRESLTSESTTRRSELQQFCQRLQADVQTLLTDAGDRRHAHAAQLNQKLDTFVQALRQETTDFLAVAHSERATMAQQLQQELITFVDDLRADVQSYLIELEATREHRATQLSRHLIRSRTARKAETHALFNRLVGFRAERQRFSQSLHNMVWGSGSAASDQADAIAPEALKNGTQPVGRVSVMPNGTVAVTATIGAFQSSGSVAVAPSTDAATAPLKESIAYEKDVYNYINVAQGARLTEIEAALDINRFQTVDALRSLIKQGLITQRDRVYLSQAQLAHT